MLTEQRFAICEHSHDVTLLQAARTAQLEMLSLYTFFLADH